jgi:hypothetical protein
VRAGLWRKGRAHGHCAHHGSRRCPGEQLTINVFEDFLRKAWKDKIEFVKLNIPNPEPVPTGPTTVIADNAGFVQSS